MKYLKKFENIHPRANHKYNLEIGDYIIVEYWSDKYKNISEYFESHIGKIKKVYHPGSWFSVEYENAPDFIENFLNNKGEFNTADILCHSKDRSECEAYLEAKKYNI